MIKHVFLFLTLLWVNSIFGQPNILLIMVDDLGYGDLSCQGATDLQTPSIDQIGAEGMTCTNFYANCTVCSPSRAALLTGRYPDRVGVPGVIRQNEQNSWGYLDERAILIPQTLKKNGYHTGIIGKWHLGLYSPNTPIERGFDYFKGFLGDMMDDYWTHRRGGKNWMRVNEEEIDPRGHATDLFTDWTLDYLKDRKADQRPFFLYLAYNAPHFPIQPPQEYLNKVRKREPDLSEKRAKNVAFIEHLDYSVGRVMDYLKSSGLEDNTLVIFTSDNGGALRYEQSNGNLRGGKQDMYEGGIKVPAFVKWKGKIEPGSRTDNFAMLMDIFPTLCSITNTSFDHQLDGMNILPTLMGESQNTDERYVFWMRREGGMSYSGQAYYAARFGHYKILQNTPFEAMQYFNLKEDPLEEKPLQLSDHEEFGILRSTLQEHIRQAGAVPWNR